MVKKDICLINVVLRPAVVAERSKATCNLSTDCNHRRTPVRILLEAAFKWMNLNMDKFITTEQDIGQWPGLSPYSRWQISLSLKFEGGAQGGG